MRSAVARPLVAPASAVASAAAAARARTDASTTTRLMPISITVVARPTTATSRSALPRSRSARRPPGTSRRHARRPSMGRAPVIDMRVIRAHGCGCCPRVPGCGEALALSSTGGRSAWASAAELTERAVRVASTVAPNPHVELECCASRLRELAQGEPRRRPKQRRGTRSAWRRPGCTTASVDLRPQLKSSRGVADAQAVVRRSARRSLHAGSGRAG